MGMEFKSWKPWRTEWAERFEKKWDGNSRFKVRQHWSNIMYHRCKGKDLLNPAHPLTRLFLNVFITLSEALRRWMFGGTI